MLFRSAPVVFVLSITAARALSTASEVSKGESNLSAMSESRPKYVRNLHPPAVNFVWYVKKDTCNTTAVRNILEEDLSTRPASFGLLFHSQDPSKLVQGRVDYLEAGWTETTQMFPTEPTKFH